MPPRRALAEHKSAPATCERQQHASTGDIKTHATLHASENASSFFNEASTLAGADSVKDKDSLPKSALALNRPPVSVPIARGAISGAPSSRLLRFPTSAARPIRSCGLSTARYEASLRGFDTERVADFFHCRALIGQRRRKFGGCARVDIGIPAEAELYCGPGEFVLLPRRSKNAHKGDAGRVLVVGGGPYTGAPAFTAMAAMRSGVDLTFVATPEPSALPVSIYSPNIIVRPLEGEILSGEHVEEILSRASGMDVVAIGPGLGNASETLQAVQEIIRKCDRPLVIDADAIVACGAKRSVLRGKEGVITPHGGEFKKLTGKALPEDIQKKSSMVREAAASLRMTILLKGPTDVISNGTFVKLNRVHNDAMTVGGTGDVLTGTVAGLLAQKATPFAAARMAAFTCGLAGNLVFEERSYGLLATDIIEKIPLVLRRYL